MVEATLVFQLGSSRAKPEPRVSTPPHRTSCTAAPTREYQSDSIVDTTLAAAPSAYLEPLP